MKTSLQNAVKRYNQIFLQTECQISILFSLFGKLAGNMLVLTKDGVTDTKKYDFPRNVELYFQITVSDQKAKLHILWGLQAYV